MLLPSLIANLHLCFHYSIVFYSKVMFSDFLLKWIAYWSSRRSFHIAYANQFIWNMYRCVHHSLFSSCLNFFFIYFIHSIFFCLYIIFTRQLFFSHFSCFCYFQVHSIHCFIIIFLSSCSSSCIFQHINFTYFDTIFIINWLTDTCPSSSTIMSVFS